MLGQILKQFSLNTTIRGLPNIARGRKKIFWITVTLLSTSICLWQCVLNVGVYLTYHIQTKSTDEVLPNVEFPAITFCPQYNIKMSTFSKIPLASDFLGIVNAYDERNIKNLTKQNELSCKTNEGVDVNDFSNILEFSKGVEDGSGALNNKFFVGFQDCTLECYWRNKLFPCNNAFINFVNDYGTCFLFNPGYEMVLKFNKTMTGKDINILEYQNMSFQVNTPNTGLRLLMRSNQEEYCGNDDVKRGAGISFKIHKKNVFHFSFHGDFFYLSPGYQTRIVLRKVIHDRKTEHLGKCASRRKLYISPESDKYVPDLCLVQCVLETCLQNCKCLAPHFRMYRDYFVQHSSDIGISGNKITICRSFDELKCLKQMHRNFTQFNLRYFPRCSHCIQPCYEETYDLQVSSTLLSTAMFSNFKSSLKKNDILKNYMVVSFELGNLNVETIEESQAFTLEDLFIYLGGNICLFLGMSFLSCVEILYICIYLGHNFVSGVEKLNKNIEKKCERKFIQGKAIRGKKVVVRRQQMRKKEKTKIKTIKVAPQHKMIPTTSNIMTTLF